MGPFETIYCSQYYEIKKNGKDAMKGRLNGTILSTVILMLVLGGLIIIVTHFVPQNPIADFLKIISGLLGYSRSGGKIIAIVFAVLIGLAINITIGSTKNYLHMSHTWEQLPEGVLQKTVKQSLFLFFIAFAFFLVSLFWV